MTKCWNFAETISLMSSSRYICFWAAEPCLSDFFLHSESKNWSTYKNSNCEGTQSVTKYFFFYLFQRIYARLWHFLFNLPVHIRFEYFLVIIKAILCTENSRIMKGLNYILFLTNFSIFLFQKLKYLYGVLSIVENTVSQKIFFRSHKYCELLILRNRNVFKGFINVSGTVKVTYITIISENNLK